MKTLRELCSEVKPKNEPKDYENVENKTIKRKSTASNISNKKIKILSPIENNQAHFSATNSLDRQILSATVATTTFSTESTTIYADRTP